MHNPLAEAGEEKPKSNSGAPGAARMRRAAAVWAALSAALRAAYEYPAYYSAWIFFGVMSITWSAPAALLDLLLPTRLAATVGQYMIMLGFRPFIAYMKLIGLITCDLRVLDTLRAERSLVIAPNHPSLLDAVFVMSRLPRAVCIVKAPIWDNLFLGGGARLAGYLRNDTALLLTRRAADAVRQGVPLLIFPEGTRTRALPHDPFKGGFALIALRAGAPVQTVFIEADAPFLCKSWPWYRKPVFPVAFQVRLGERIEVGSDVRQFVCDLESYYRRELTGSAAVPTVEP